MKLGSLSVLTVRASEAGTVATDKSAIVSSSQVNSVNVWQYIHNITEITFMRCILCSEDHGWLVGSIYSSGCWHAAVVCFRRARVDRIMPGKATG